MGIFVSGVLLGGLGEGARLAGVEVFGVAVDGDGVSGATLVGIGVAGMGVGASDTVRLAVSAEANIQALPEFAMLPCGSASPWLSTSPTEAAYR